MKKTFKLKVENKNPDRLLESIKHEIRKYIKREKSKFLPDGVDFWKLECKFAQNDEAPSEIKFEDIMAYVNEAAVQGCDSFYLEILSTKGTIVPKEKKVYVPKEKTVEDGEAFSKTSSDY
jgi:hypothetical protein